MNRLVYDFYALARACASHRLGLFFLYDWDFFALTRTRVNCWNDSIERRRISAKNSSSKSKFSVN